MPPKQPNPAGVQGGAGVTKKRRRNRKRGTLSETLGGNTNTNNNTNKSKGSAQARALQGGANAALGGALTSSPILLETVQAVIASVLEESNVSFAFANNNPGKAASSGASPTTSSNPQQQQASSEGVAQQGQQQQQAAMMNAATAPTAVSSSGPAAAAVTAGAGTGSANPSPSKAAAVSPQQQQQQQQGGAAASSAAASAAAAPMQTQQQAARPPVAAATTQRAGGHPPFPPLRPGSATGAGGAPRAAAVRGVAPRAPAAAAGAVPTAGVPGGQLRRVVSPAPGPVRGPTPTTATTTALAAAAGGAAGAPRAALPAVVVPPAIASGAPAPARAPAAAKPPVVPRTSSPNGVAPGQTATPRPPGTGTETTPPGTSPVARPASQPATTAAAVVAAAAAMAPLHFTSGSPSGQQPRPIRAGGAVRGPAPGPRAAGSAPVARVPGGATARPRAPMPRPPGQGQQQQGAARPPGQARPAGPRPASAAAAQGAQRPPAQLRPGSPAVTVVPNAGAVRAPTTTTSTTAAKVSPPATASATGLRPSPPRPSQSTTPATMPAAPGAAAATVATTTQQQGSAAVKRAGSADLSSDGAARKQARMDPTDAEKAAAELRQQLLSGLSSGGSPATVHPQHQHQHQQVVMMTTSTPSPVPSEQAVTTMAEPRVVMVSTAASEPVVRMVSTMSPEPAEPVHPHHQSVMERIVLAGHTSAVAVEAAAAAAHPPKKPQPQRSPTVPNTNTTTTAAGTTAHAPAATGKAASPPVTAPAPRPASPTVVSAPKLSRPSSVQGEANMDISDGEGPADTAGPEAEAERLRALLMSQANKSARAGGAKRPSSSSPALPTEPQQLATEAARSATPSSAPALPAALPQQVHPAPLREDTDSPMSDAAPQSIVSELLSIADGEGQQSALAPIKKAWMERDPDSTLNLAEAVRNPHMRKLLKLGHNDRMGRPHTFFCNLCVKFFTTESAGGSHLRVKGKGTHEDALQLKGEMHKLEAALRDGKALSKHATVLPSAVFKEAEEKLESLALSLRAHPADLADCSELLTAIESLLEPLKEPSGAVVHVASYARVGAGAKGTQLAGQPPHFDLLVMCGEAIARNTVDRLSSHLSATLAPPKQGGVYWITRGAVSFQIGLPQSQSAVTILLAQAPLSPDPVVSDDDKASLKRNYAMLARAQWFAIEASGHPLLPNMVRVLKSFRQHTAAWDTMETSSLEVMCAHVLNKFNTVPTLLAALRGVFSLVAAGVLYPGGLTLKDPCDDSDDDFAAYLSLQDRETVTAAGQNILRQLAFGQVRALMHQ